jgi:hypothetical protein
LNPHDSTKSTNPPAYEQNTKAQPSSSYRSRASEIAATIPS